MSKAEERSKEIMQAALDYANNLDDVKPTDGFSRNLCIALGQAFMKGAEWADKHQAEKDLRDIFNNGWSEGYEVGRDSMEEDMMKNAVEEIVDIDSNGLACINVDGYLPGDKIKVYIFKEA